MTTVHKLRPARVKPRRTSQERIIASRERLKQLAVAYVVSGKDGTRAERLTSASSLSRLSTDELRALVTEKHGNDFFTLNRLR